MKRYFISIMLVMIISLSMVQPVNASDIPVVANQKFVITIDGNLIDFSIIGEPMLLTTGRTFVPERFMSKYLAYNGHNPNYSEEIASQNIWINDEDTKIEMTLNKSTAIVNGKAVYIDYTPDGKPVIDSKPYIYEEKVYVPLRFICETLGEKVEYEKIGDVHHIEITTRGKSQDTKNTEDDFKEIQSLVGYIRIENNTVHFDEVEIVELENQGRVKELGLNAYDMPNGYAIINENKEDTTYELADKVHYIFTDINLDFLYESESEGNRIYVTTKKDEFLKHFGKLNDIPLSEQTIPYFIEVQDGKIKSITEKFEYTI
jgi:hypothetical protein